MTKFLKNSNHFTNSKFGASRDRTDDPLRARQMLSQLSYSPSMVGQGGLEPPASPLSGVRSNQLSYRPYCHVICVSTHNRMRLVKEVIQPQVPLRLPCYDLTPVMNHTVVGDLSKVSLPASGTTHSHGLTGSVYKARERIHRDILIRDY
jgi:hypothetical protein